MTGGIFLILTLSLTLSNAEKVVSSIRWKNFKTIPMLEVHFVDSSSKVFKLTPTEPILFDMDKEGEEEQENCIFTGGVLKSKEFSIVVSGCPGSFMYDVMLYGPNLQYSYYNVNNGVAHPVDMGLELRGKNTFIDQVGENEKLLKNYLPINETRLPTSATVNVRMVFDQGFKDRFGKKSRLQAKTTFHMASMPFLRGDLGIPIMLNIVSLEFRPGENWDATGRDLSWLVKMNATSSNESIHINAFITNSNDQDGTIGIAFFGVACAHTSTRVMISEFVKNNGLSSLVLAHEMGHNLGLLHDDQGGRTCNGIMNSRLGSGTTASFSSCSKNDFMNYVNSLSTVCFADGPIMPTTTTTTTSTSVPCRDQSFICRRLVRKSLYHRLCMTSSRFRSLCRRSCNACN